MTFPVLQTIGSSTETTSTTVVITAPTGITNDDILIAAIYITTASVITPPVDEGWTFITDVLHSIAEFRIAFYWKRALNEPSNYTFILGTSSYNFGTITRVSGCIATGSPINVFGTGQASTNTATAPSITTTVADTLLLLHEANDSQFRATPGGSLTEVFDANTIGIYKLNFAAIGATGTQSVTLTGAANNAAAMFALTPVIPPNVDLIVSNVSNATSFGAPALVQANTLSVAGVAHSNTFTVPALVQSNVLAVDNILHSQLLETPLVDASFILIVSSLAHTVVLEVPDLVRNFHLLTVDNLAQAQTIGSATLSANPPPPAPVSNVPIILAEASVLVSGIETTRYLSTLGFITESGDTPASANYLPLLVGTIETTETISITGSPSFSFTDLEILNPAGSLDSWLLDIWSNRPLKLYFGYRGQLRSQFTLIFDGIIATIGSKSYSSLNLSVRDKLQRLNAPLSETVLGGTSVNKASIIPNTFGEVFNISPLLTNDATHEYQVSSTAIEDIIEVRDNGVPISVTKQLATGKFTLLARPAGTITCSVQGYKVGTYYTDIANSIKNIVLNFGKAVDMFQSGDIDNTNFLAFSTSFPQSIGYYVNSKENIITIIQALAASLGAQVLCNRLGKLQLFQIDLGGTSTFTIQESMVLSKSLSIASRPEVQSTVILNYCKNWTQQDSLETGVVSLSKELFKNEWVPITQTDSTVATQRKHSILPAPIDTQLVNTSEATAEASRRLVLWKTQRTVFQLQGTKELANLTIGQTVTLQHSRFNLSTGVKGLVISLKMDWTTNRPTLQILV